MQIRNILILVAAAGAVAAHKNTTTSNSQIHPSVPGGIYSRVVPTPEAHANPAQGQNTTFNGWPNALKAVDDTDGKSAGDYYSAPTSSDAAVSFPTDTSDVSATFNELPPAPTVSRNGIENGANAIAGVSSLLGSFAAALAACFL